MKRRADFVLIGDVVALDAVKHDVVSRGYSVAMLTGGEPVEYCMETIAAAKKMIVIVGVRGSVIICQDGIPQVLKKKKEDIPSVLLTDSECSSELFALLES